ncbi:MAG TPA: hypothetical protein VN663_11930 [Ramlibacter sp.]|nr:hypothetical protein [Ramlibacter sp.]
MTRTIWTPTLAWLAAVTAALVLALAAPNESNFLGQLPRLSVKRLDQQRVVLPQELPAPRTLALVAFRSSQREEIRSWVEGLRLDQDDSIAWFKMPVLKDPGSESARSDIESVLLARHPADIDRSRLVPVFTDRDAFIRAAGLPGNEHAWVLVLDREGKVLARAEGRFDQDKAQALRETLLAVRN